MKLAKLSLAAIMAVGALSTANATSLEEAIKGVDLSGYGYYRFHDASGAEAYNKIELRAQLTAPVQENIQFVTRFTGNYITRTNATSGSATPKIDRLFFNYKGFDKTTVTLGRMYAGTPLDDAAALGLKVVTSPVDGLTLAVAYFNDNSAVTNALMAGAVIYSNDMFNARLWYIDKASENASASNGAGYLFLEGGANVGPVAIKAQYAQRDADANTYTDKTMRIQVGGKFGPAALRVGYTKNDKKGGNVVINGAEGDHDLINGGIYGLVQSNGADDRSLFGEVKVAAGKFGVKAGYVDYSKHTFDSQYYGQVDYAMTKKFSVYARYGSASYSAAGLDDKTLARFNATYKF